MSIFRVTIPCVLALGIDGAVLIAMVVGAHRCRSATIGPPMIVIACTRRSLSVLRFSGCHATAVRDAVKLEALDRIEGSKARPFQEIANWQFQIECLSA